jgi:hypothetical protein
MESGWTKKARLGAFGRGSSRAVEEDEKGNSLCSSIGHFAGTKKLFGAYKFAESFSSIRRNA